MIVDLPDGRELELPDDMGPNQLQMVKDKLRQKYAPTQYANPVTSSTPTSTAGERAESYVLGRARDFGNAAVRLSGDIEGRTNRPLSEAGMDLLTVGGPPLAAASGLGGTLAVLGGLGAGAATRAGGGSEEEAALADAATNLGVGLGGAAVSGTRAVSGLRAGIKRTYDEVAAAAAARGRTVTQGGQLANDLEAAVGQGWAPRAPETWVVRNLTRRLRDPNAPGITYQDLDMALRRLTGIRGM